MTAGGSVFITDFDNRKALAAARNLGRHGVTVIGGSDDPTAIGRFSRHTSHFVRYPSPRKTPQDYAAFMLDYLRAHPVDVLMPMDDETVLLAAEHRDALSRLTAVPVPPLEIVRRARDKADTMRWAEAAGVRFPRTWMPASPEEVDARADTVPYPALIKPRESSGSRGIRVVQTPAELRADYARIHAQFPLPIVQEYIPFGGGKYHVAVLMDADSRVRALYTQRVIREWPVRGGVGTFWVSDHHAGAEVQTVRLLERMQWGPGVTLTEFLIDPRDGTAFLMEVNPRFWGTLQGSISAGVEFPYLVYRMMRGEPFEPVTDYPTGIACQWELPGDLLHFVFNPDRWRADPPYLARRGEARSYAVWADDDRLPALGFFAGVLYHLFDARRWKHVFRRL